MTDHRRPKMAKDHESISTLSRTSMVAILVTGRRYLWSLTRDDADRSQAGVHDHIEFVLAGLDMFTSTSENLINYAFNMASYEINESMRRLTLVRIIFLPLALLAGYFPFGAVDHHSDILFWQIAIPLMVALLPVFLYPDLVNFVQYVKKRLAWRGMAEA
ncbi:hypothetical protein AX15_001368 [Amanita polypyramis BW_CC]|nr:hypothetical protein AX15_001368 [Amanita polypyramis BW_CC]